MHDIRKRKVVRVALTPLIDVVFILLLFFLLTSTFTFDRTIDLTVAETVLPSSTPVESPPPLRLTVNDDDTVQIEGVVYSVEDSQLVSRIEILKNQTGSLRAVIVSATSRASVQQLITVLDTLNANGVTDIDLTQSGNQ